jgi:hypothetical protein
LALFSPFWLLVPQSLRVSTTRRSPELHTHIFIVAARHEAHEADAIIERATNDVLVGYRVSSYLIYSPGFLANLLSPPLALMSLLDTEYVHIASYFLFL